MIQKASVSDYPAFSWRAFMLESFCDYILSQNAYETSDGSTIKLPNIYDYVYEGDDGKIYAGNTADQPAGSTRLYAK